MFVIGHRGASGHAPENTMAAFRKAVALGATFIETDMQLSRDAHFVAIHDPTVNRTTNGRGEVHELLLAQLRSLDAGTWFGSEFAGERIPTLDEILQFSKKTDVVFYLEMKPGGAWGGEHALIGALRDRGHEVFAEGYTDTVNDLIRDLRAEALVLDCTAFDMSESLFDIVRHHPNHAEFPIVIISDTPEKADASLGSRNAQKVLLIPKPFTGSQVARALDQLLR